MDSSPRPGFRAGLESLFGGLWWTLTTPSVWPLATVPVVLGTLLTIVLGWFAAGSVPTWIANAIGPTSSAAAGIGVAVLGVVAAVLAVLASAFVGFALAQPLAGPALEGIVRRVEGELGAPARPSSGLATEILRSFQSLAISYSFGVPALLLLLLLTVVVPYASIVLFPLKLLVAAITLSWDLCDYPMSVRGLGIRQRVDTVLRYPGAVLGFGLGLALGALVPCLLFLLLPGGVAGSARLMWRIETFERTAGSKPDGVLRLPGE